MQKKDVDAMSVSVESEKSYASSEQPPSFHTSVPDDIPPPAYRKPKSTAVEIAKIVALTVLAATFILGVFIVAAAWLQARASCVHKEHPVPVVSETIVSQPLIDPLPPASTTKPPEVTEGSQKQEEEVEERQEESRFKLPLSLVFDEMADQLLSKNLRADMKCVVEKKKIEDIVDKQPKDIQLPFGVNISTDPRYQHLTGEKMAINCQSGDRDRPAVPPFPFMDAIGPLPLMPFLPPRHLSPGPHRRPPMPPPHHHHHMPDQFMDAHLPPHSHMEDMDIPHRRRGHDGHLSHHERGPFIPLRDFPDRPLPEGAFVPPERRRPPVKAHTLPPVPVRKGQPISPNMPPKPAMLMMPPEPRQPDSRKSSPPPLPLRDLPLPLSPLVRALTAFPFNISPSSKVIRIVSSNSEVPPDTPPVIINSNRMARRMSDSSIVPHPSLLNSEKHSIRPRSVYEGSRVKRCACDCLC